MHIVRSQWMVTSCWKQDRTTDGGLNPVIKWLISGCYVNMLDLYSSAAYNRAELFKKLGYIDGQSYSKMANEEEGSSWRNRDMVWYGVCRFLSGTSHLTSSSLPLFLALTWFHLLVCGHQEKHCRLKSVGHDRVRWKIPLIHLCLCCPRDKGLRLKQSLTFGGLIYCTLVCAYVSGRGLIWLCTITLT